MSRTLSVVPSPSAPSIDWQVATPIASVDTFERTPESHAWPACTASTALSAVGTTVGAVAGAGASLALGMLDFGVLTAVGATLGATLGSAMASFGFRPRDARDYGRFPMVAVHAGYSPLYAVSDIHGHSERAFPLLQRWGLIADAEAEPEAMRWTGGRAHLVVVGDMVDKGPHPVRVLRTLMYLQRRAADAGGRVTVLAGNHEAEFLANPHNRKASKRRGFNTDIRAHGWRPEEVASDRHPIGHWLRRLPLGLRAGRWFFAHAGNTHGKKLHKLEHYLEHGLNRGGFADRRITGHNSILQARGWWHQAHNSAERCTRKLHVDHVVFGHDPHALGRPGTMGVSHDGRLLRIDCGMSDRNDSDGGMLRVSYEHGRERVECLWPDGRSDLLLA